MRQSAIALKEGRKAKVAGEEAFLAGLTSSLNDKDMADLAAAAQAGAAKLTGLEGMLGMINAANEKKVAAEQEAVEQRAKLLTGALLGAGLGAEKPEKPPSLQNLASLATELQNKHEQLLQRHAVSETALHGVLGRLTAAVKKPEELSPEERTALLL